MAALGAVYLVFEDKLMVNFGDSRPSRKNETISRTLIGIQVSESHGLRVALIATVVMNLADL